MTDLYTWVVLFLMTRASAVIGKLLSNYCQRSIQEIGSIDVSHTLLERCNSNQGQSHRDFAESFECGFEVFEPSTRSTAGR
jgi:hypothetical protein